MKKRVSETESEPGTGASGFKEQDPTPKNRDRQRSHFYEKLYKRFHELCAKYGISTSVKPYLVPSAAQPELFD